MSNKRRPTTRDIPFKWVDFIEAKAAAVSCDVETLSDGTEVSSLWSYRMLIGRLWRVKTGDQGVVYVLWYSREKRSVTTSKHQSRMWVPIHELKRRVTLVEARPDAVGVSRKEDYHSILIANDVKLETQQ